MQFTVLIEFLVSGLLTTLLVLVALPCGAIPEFPVGISASDTVQALLLLAVSYPVGILINLPVFKLQKYLLSPRVQRALIKEYDARDIDLISLSAQQIARKQKKKGEPEQRGQADQAQKTKVLTREELGDVFGFLRAPVFGKNIDRLNHQHLYHEGLQRLSRGMLIPLIFAPIVWFCKANGSVFSNTLVLAVFGFLFAMSLWLLTYSIKTEDEQIIRFFIALIDADTEPTLASVPQNREILADRKDDRE
ncbi:MAG TPA: hypothetical protein VN851_09275 [Thermoanaerobaculia bacterium]|nr:hypothetical protein [Thermoanaerobaculia bacterium]